MSKSNLENKFLTLWKAYHNTKGIAGLMPVREYKFHPKRKWRFDFAFIVKGSKGSNNDIKIAVEIEGGLYMPKSGHTNIKGFVSNCDKFNQAQAMGWKVFRFTEKHLRERAIESIEMVIKALDCE